MSTCLRTEDVWCLELSSDSSLTLSLFVNIAVLFWKGVLDEFPVKWRVRTLFLALVISSAEMTPNCHKSDKNLLSLFMS